MERIDIVDKIVEGSELVVYLGYQEIEGQALTLVGLTEAEADKRIAEFEATGKIEVPIPSALSTIVIEPTALMKLRTERILYKIPEGRVVRLAEGEQQ